MTKRIDLSDVITQLPVDEILNPPDEIGHLRLHQADKGVKLGLVRPGHYGISDFNDDFIDLGDTIDIIPFACRPKAMDMSGLDAVVTCYDPKSEGFKRISAQSVQKGSSCVYGVSFLVYERSTGRFVEFFCGVKSTRDEAKNICPFLPLTDADIRARGLSDQQPRDPQPLTLKTRLVKKGSYSFHVPMVVGPSAPFDIIPDSGVVVERISEFIRVALTR